MIRAFCRALAAAAFSIAVVVPPLAARATARRRSGGALPADEGRLRQGLGRRLDLSLAGDVSRVRSSMPGARTRCSIPTIPRTGSSRRSPCRSAAGLHYNPLTNHDAAVWWVREAADWVVKNSQDPTLIGQAQSILAARELGGRTRGARAVCRSGCDRELAKRTRATSTRCSTRSRPIGAPGC